MQPHQEIRAKFLAGKNGLSPLVFVSTDSSTAIAVLSFWVDRFICGVCSVTIGIKHGFSCMNIRQVPWEVLKTEAEDRGFQHLPRDLANVNALKNHVRSLLLHKN